MVIAIYNAPIRIMLVPRTYPWQIMSSLVVPMITRVGKNNVDEYPAANRKRIMVKRMPIVFQRNRIRIDAASGLSSSAKKEQLIYGVSDYT